MPLAFLLDENITPAAAEQMHAQRPDIPVHSVHTWREGALAGRPDHEALEASRKAGLTLVTYDLRILAEQAAWFEQGQSFPGLTFVDNRSIPSHDVGRLIRALIRLWDRELPATWTVRLVFLSGAEEL